MTEPAPREETAIPTTAATRFWERLQPGDPGDCWEWPGSRSPAGYGYVTIERKGHRAHRLAYRLAKGAIPAGLFVCHRCDNPPCCNPAHLFLGTHTDNVRDCRDKGRLKPPPWKNRKHTARGERQGSARLTEQAVRDIKRLLPHEGDTAIARRYGVSRRSIRFIRTGETWAWVQVGEAAHG
jgi:hypothetical protein